MRTGLRFAPSLSCLLLLCLTPTVCAQDLEELFGRPGRELTQLTRVDGRAARELRRATRAEERGDLEEALAIYAGLLGENAAADGARLVRTPVGSRSSLFEEATTSTQCLRRMTDVVMARILDLPPELGERYLERTAPRARALWKFHEETGDEATLVALSEGFLLHEEGARALRLRVDLAFEGGQIGKALSLATRWLRFSSGRSEDDVRAMRIRRARAAVLLGHVEIARRESALANVDWSELESAARTRQRWTRRSNAAVTEGGAGADAPNGSLPASLTEALVAAVEGGAGVEFQLGTPFVHSTFARSGAYPLSGFQSSHELHRALPLVEPSRAGELIWLQMPTRLECLDLSRGGDQTIYWEPEGARAFLGGNRRDRRFLRVNRMRGEGLYDALRNSAESNLLHLPLPRVPEQWLRFRPVLAVEPPSTVEASLGGRSSFFPGSATEPPEDAREWLVAYVVLGEDNVIRGFQHAGAALKVLLATRTEPEGGWLALPTPRIVWLAELGRHLPSSPMLLRQAAGRVACGLARDPSRQEASITKAVVDLDARTGEILSLTPVSQPQNNRGWMQDEEVIAHVHPVSLSLDRDGRIVMLDHRGTIACIDPYDLREVEGEPPACTITWALTYPSMHVDEDAFDSGLRGWAASGIACLEDGRVAVAPRDSNELMVIGPDPVLARDGAAFDLELPILTRSRGAEKFFLGVQDGRLLACGDRTHALDIDSGAGWESAPAPDDGVRLRRSARVDGFVVEPRRDHLRVLDLQSGRLAGILRFPAELEFSQAEFLTRARRMGVACLGDVLLVTTEHGVVGWRLQ